MYKLYWSADSGAFAPHAVLSEVGAQYELIEVDLASDEHYSADFLAVNPRAQVPVMTLPDDTVLTESVAMMMHLADCHPSAELLPAPGDNQRALAYRWLVFSSVNLYETGCRIGDTHHYSSNETDYDGIRAKGLSDLDRYWDIVVEALGDGPYLLGKKFCIADICLLMLSQWHPNIDELLARHPSLMTLRTTVKTRPAIDKIWDQNFN